MPVKLLHDVMVTQVVCGRFHTICVTAQSQVRHRGVAVVAVVPTWGGGGVVPCGRRRANTSNTSNSSNTFITPNTSNT